MAASDSSGSVLKSASGLSVELPCQRGAGRSDPLPVFRQIPVQLADQRPGPDHVLLGAAGREPFAGDRPEVLEDLAVLGQDLLDLQARVEVVIGALHGGDGVELGGGQLGQGDLNVRLGRLPAEPQRAEPRELLRERQVVRVVAHQRVLRRDARDGEDRVRGDRVVQRRDLRDAVPQRLDVVVGGLHRPVLGQRPADEDVHRLRTRQFGRGQDRVRLQGHRLGGVDRFRWVVGGRPHLPVDLRGIRPPGRLAQPTTAQTRTAVRAGDHRRAIACLLAEPPRCAYRPRNRQRRSNEPV